MLTLLMLSVDYASSIVFFLFYVFRISKKKKNVKRKKQDLKKSAV